MDTDLSPAEADAVIRQLEHTRRVLTQVVFGGEASATPRLRVLALRYDEYANFDRDAVGEYISNVLFEPLLLTSPGGVWGTYQPDTANTSSRTPYPRCTST